MRHLSKFTVRHAALALVVASVAVAGCRPKPPETPPAPVPQPPEVSAPAAQTDAHAHAQGGAHGDAHADAASAPAATSAHGTTANAVASTASPAREPELAKMTVARDESAKIGVPADLRYQVDGDATDGRPVTVHLAAVPRIAGANLSMSVKEDPLLQAAVTPLRAEKALADTAYRQQMAVTRLAGAPAELRVLVTMETPEGLAFSWFGVPLTASASAAQQAKTVDAH